MSCEYYTPDCEARDCIECETNICEAAEDCAGFNPESCIGAGVSKCDDFFSIEDAEDMMHPNESHDDYIEHEDLG